MALYCGIDLHPNNRVLAVMDDQDKSLYHKRLPNDLSQIIAALQPYRQDLPG